ncbi:aldehyde oxidase 1-like [Gastrophryne carolinensis]
MESDELIFFVNGKKITERKADPEEMLLPYLRRKLQLTGTKYGCGGGGCGACTVMISHIHPVTKKIIHYSVVACLLPICSLHGAAVTTVEGIGSSTTKLHPIQERIAKAHGSQCGFCSPGMVMSMYSLLRNHPEPTMEQIYEAFGGNLCRCTGYRPIIDGCKTFCKELNCCKQELSMHNGQANNDEEGEISTLHLNTEECLLLDPSQELIFPPELILMSSKKNLRTLVFQGEKVKWITVFNLEELLKLKVNYPQAPLVVGNSSLGPEIKFKGAFHPVLISIGKIDDLHSVEYTKDGISVGAACTLSTLKDIMNDAVTDLPEEKTKTFRALLQQLKTLAGQQIRNVASIGGHIIQRNSNSDLNPILAAGHAILQTMAKGGKTRQILCNEDFLESRRSGLYPEEILVSVLIPYSQKGEIVSAFRQAQRKVNSAPIVVAGMQVCFHENSDVIKDLNLYFGGISENTVGAKKTKNALIGRRWNEETLSEACRLVLDEITLEPSAPAGKVEYRRTLTVSFLFKFYLEVLSFLKSQRFALDEKPKHEIENVFWSFCAKTDEYLEQIYFLPPLLQEYFQLYPLNNVNCKKYITELSYNNHVKNGNIHDSLPRSKQKYPDTTVHQPMEDPVGRPIMHHSALMQVSGEAVYCDDIPVINGELFMALVTSSKAHAQIISVDLTEALNVTGVYDIITAKDVPGSNDFSYYYWPDQLMADDQVLCVGYIICAVVADTPERAKQAAKMVKIAYKEIQPVILTIEDAINYNSFFEPERRLEYGNVDEAFTTADHILEGEIHIGGQEHFYMETQSIRVVPKNENQEIDIYAATQDPTYMQSLVGKALGIPSNRISCHVKRIGGAFGGKIVKTAYIAAIAAVAANKTKHPVRCILERGEDMLITAGRHPYLGKYKVGFMNDGRIVAADVTLYSNGGCRGTESIFIMEISVLATDGPYYIPNLRCCGKVCKTNLPSNISFRGFGFPQCSLVTEVWIDEIASRCNLPPHQVREINMYRGIVTAPYKQVFDTTNLTQCWEECIINSAYYTRREAINQFNKQNQWKKRGIALIPMKYPVTFIVAYQNQAAALVHIYHDGSVLVSHGGTEMGQGIHTKITQIASRELGIPISYIHICETNTAAVPNTIATAASVGTDVNGMAVKNACEKLRKRLEPIISKNPKGSWECWITEAFQQTISLSATGYFKGYETHMDWEKGVGCPFAYCVYGAACSEVEIDCLTGDSKNLRTDIIMDTGRSLNPAMDIGQIEGAFVQGIGLFTTEELKYSPEGALLAYGPGEYKIPSVYDIPKEFNVSLLHSSHNPNTIYSSKGIGEPAVFLGSAVYLAIKDSIASARKERGLSSIFTLNSPATPEKIRMACGDKFTNMIKKDNPATCIPSSIDTVPLPPLIEVWPFLVDLGATPDLENYWTAPGVGVPSGGQPPLLPEAHLHLPPRQCQLTYPPCDQASGFTLSGDSSGGAWAVVEGVLRRAYPLPNGLDAGVLGGAPRLGTCALRPSVPIDSGSDAPLCSASSNINTGSNRVSPQLGVSQPTWPSPSASEGPPTPEPIPSAQYNLDVLLRFLPSRKDFENYTNRMETLFRREIEVTKSVSEVADRVQVLEQTQISTDQRLEALERANLALETAQATSPEQYFIWMTWRIGEGGFNIPEKLSKILYDLQKQRVKIALLQETHFKADHIPKIRHEFFPSWHHCPNPIGKSKRVSIAHHKSLPHEILESKVDPQDRRATTTLRRLIISTYEQLAQGTYFLVYPRYRIKQNYNTTEYI